MLELMTTRQDASQHLDPAQRNTCTVNMLVNSVGPDALGSDRTLHSCWRNAPVTSRDCGRVAARGRRARATHSFSSAGLSPPPLPHAATNCSSAVIDAAASDPRQRWSFSPACMPEQPCHNSSTS